jgi:hypothetical protein
VAGETDPTSIAYVAINPGRVSGVCDTFVGVLDRSWLPAYSESINTLRMGMRCMTGLMS